MSYDEQYSYKWDMWDSRTQEEVAEDEAATQRIIDGYEPEGDFI